MSGGSAIDQVPPASGELALIYIREDPALAVGPTGQTLQQRECEELCLQHGWHVAAFIADSGPPEPGNETSTRLTRLAQALADHHCSVLVITDLDRIARDAGAVADFVQMINASVRIATVERGLMSPLETTSILYWAREPVRR